MRLVSRRTALTSLVAAGGALAAHRAFAKPREFPLDPVRIEVEARETTHFQPTAEAIRFGKLEFRGGLVLTSSYPGFGGISGFALQRDGRRFLAVTDAGLLLDGELATDGDRPTGLANVRACALKDDRGRPLALQGREDAESLTLSPRGVFVGLETMNEIWLYPADPMGQIGMRIDVPPGVKALRFNLGLESLAYAAEGPLAGTLIAIGEEGASKSADLPGFLIGGPTPGTFTIAKSGPFNGTDACVGPDGVLYLLERHFSFSTGVLMQVRRFSLSDVKPGARLSGEILFTADMAYEIDNMEGLAVTRNAAGEILLTMISDDNFSALQRNVLLRFAVVG